ncbi:uncharacterized protein LOC141901678 [Tubulanus polymorphus]|uniref:uncharacterized protein LOC141901678 n=1 Tax=Tubulanus polymorphus TaxID=672921 RepID=UPI003DA1F9EC
MRLTELTRYIIILVYIVLINMTLAAKLMPGMSISCFVCTSYNFSNPHCHDPFNPYYVPLVKDCKQGREGHIGEFPAYYCIKIKGYRKSDGLEMLVRRCSIGRITERQVKLGQFIIERTLYHGYMTTCHSDGCNHGNSVRPKWFMYIVALVMTLCITSGWK